MTRSEVSATAMSAMAASPMNALSRGCGMMLVPVAENKANRLTRTTMQAAIQSSR